MAFFVRRGPVPKTKDQLIPQLHKYLMAASLMAGEFDRHIAEPPEFKATDPSRRRDDVPRKQGWYQDDVWYGCLYVVIEGWREIGMSDPEVSPPDVPKAKLLQDVRNSVFYFQRQWMDKRLERFITG